MQSQQTPPVLNGSAVLTFQECPQRWDFIYRLGRRPKRLFEPAPLLGTAFHAAIARGLNGGPWDIEEPAELAAQLPEKADKWRKEAETLRYALAGWSARHRIGPFWDELIATEREMHGTLDDGTRVMGRVDAVVRAQGGFWGVQFKTRFGSRGIADYARVIKRSVHEALYATLIRQAGFEPYFGTLLHVFTKDALHSRAAGATCEHCGAKGLQAKPPEAFHHEFMLAIEPELIARASRDIARVGAQMRAGAESGAPPEQREHACVGINRTCIFFKSRVCDALASIDDDDLFESFEPLAAYTVADEGDDA